MAILGFKKRFIKPVKSGVKTQTIRAFRKYPVRVFEQLYLYTALRTRYAQKLGEAQCIGTKTITIKKNCFILNDGMLKLKLTFKDPRQLNQFAKDDGFTSWEDLQQFWIDSHGPKCFPFTGTIIYWNLLPKSQWLKKAKRKKVNLQFA
jgi:hypothetical protein